MPYRLIYIVLFVFFSSSLFADSRATILAAIKNELSVLKSVDGSLKKDREFILKAVKINGNALKYANDSLKKDKEVVLAAVQVNGGALKYADDSFKKDKEVVLAAVQDYGGALDYSDDSFKKDKEVVLAAVQNNGHVLEHADDSLKKDKEVVLAAVQESGYALEHADDSLKKDKEIVMAAVKEKGDAFIFADLSLRKNKKVILAALPEHEYALLYAYGPLEKDKEFVLALKNKGYVLDKNQGEAKDWHDFFDETLLDFQLEIDIAVEEGKKGVLLLFDSGSSRDAIFRNTVLIQSKVHDYFRDNFRIIILDKLESDLEVIDFEGNLTTMKEFVFFQLRIMATPTFQFFDLKGKAAKNGRHRGGFKSAEEFLLFGKFLVEEQNRILPFSRYLKLDKLRGTIGSNTKDKGIVLAAVKNNGLALQFADELLKNDKEVVLTAVKNKGRSLSYASDSLKKDKAFILEVVKNEVDGLEFADESLKKSEKFMLAAIKNNIRAYQYADDTLKVNDSFIVEAIKNSTLILNGPKEGYKDVLDSLTITPFMTTDVKEDDITNHIGNKKWTIVEIFNKNNGINQLDGLVEFDGKLDNVRVLGISLEKDNTLWTNLFLIENNVKFPVIISDYSYMINWMKMNVGETLERGQPTFLIFDPEGKIVAAQTGQLKMSSLEDFIKKNSKK